MTSRLALRLDLILALPAFLIWLGSAGCGSSSSGTSEPVCTPACPNGTRCSADGCVSLSAPPDLSGVGGQPDLPPGSCSPACAAPTPYCNASKVCVGCLDDSNCPSGSVCRASGQVALCVQGCTSDARCGGGSMRCCNNVCTDTATDAANCGGCGAPCSAPHATSTCNGGACGSGACNPGWGDCNKNPSDGCEANLHTDSTNCSTCGNQCKIANAYSGCSDGCYIAACQFGFDDCNAMVADGCETSVLSDPKNCGSCGNGCTPPPHAMAGCVNAACQLTSCVVGYADCNGNPRDGCEVNIFGDAKNCGVCGNDCGQGLVCKNGGCTCPQCNFPNASSKCLNQVCVIDKCTPGFADCNGNPKDGCEVDISKDPNNCGGCNNVCPQQTPYCKDSMCSVIPPATIFTAKFNQGQDAQGVCPDWQAFQKALDKQGYASITINGSNDMVGVTCNGAGADTICQALHNGSNVIVQCDGHTWQTGNCGGGLELSASASTCQCTNPGYIARPCIGAQNSNWGGINTATCNGPTQTITVTCSL